MCAQQAVPLPAPSQQTGPVLGSFHFVSDGPAGPGWTRPDEIPRFYPHDVLPALFERSIVLADDLPAHSTLRWIFTGPRAGLTVELTSNRVRIAERYYDSLGLLEGHGSYPERTILERERQFTGSPRTLTVIADSHLSVRVLVNGQQVLDAPLLFDLSRHQVAFAAPRVLHEEVSGTLHEPAAVQAAVDLRPSETHQTMLGFGGSPSIPAYFELSEAGRDQYWQILKRYHLLISREYPMGTELKPDLSNLDNLAEATPHYYGDNFPNGEVSSFDYNRKINAMGGQVIYELWALPKWAQEPYNGPAILDAWNKRVRMQARPEEYARIVVEYCRKEQARTGAAPSIIGIQNEVEQPPAVFRAMTIAVRRALDEAGFRQTQIHMADASFLWMAITRAADLQQDPAAWKAIDFAAAHQYDFQEFAADPELYEERMRAMRKQIGDKPFLATEICFNDGHLQEPSYRIALVAAELYHRNLTELDAVGLLYCWLLLDVEQPTFAGSRSLLAIDRSRGGVPIPSSFQLRVLGAYSRHISAGMKRIGAVSADPALRITAFADGDKRTFVVTNSSAAPRTVTIRGAESHWREIERVGPEEENLVQPVTQPSLGELRVAPGEIVILSTLKAD